MNHKYLRQERLAEFGKEKQQLLQNAKVLIIGAGGLGCPALLYLAACGTGNLTIVDHDTVDVTNLHRQTLYGEEDIGQLKALTAAQKISRMHPNIFVQPITQKLTASLALQLFKEFDVIVDATDNFETRYLINDVCVFYNKPFVYGSLHKFQGQISVFNYQNGPTLRCVFPTPPSPDEVPNCNETGILGVLPGIVGCMQALETIKLITHLEGILSGSLLLIDTLSHHYLKFSIARNETLWTEEIPRTTEEILHYSYPAFCGIQTSHNFEQYANQNEYLIIDVREPYEQPRIDLHNIIEIPLAQLPDELSRIPRNKKIITLCQHGQRSIIARHILIASGYNDVISFEGGVAILPESYWKK